MNDQIKKALLSGAVLAAVLTTLNYAGKYVIAQEAEKVVKPVRVEQQATSKLIAEMRFKDQYDEAQTALAACREEGFSEPYCQAQDEWRWEVYYPYVDCIAGLDYKDREDACGPVPEPPNGAE